MLVVDDDERVLASLSRSLESRHEVFTATTSPDATLIARRERPNLALVDLHLGAFSGLDLVRALKAELPDIVVVLLSGYLTIDTAVSAAQAGADVVVTKPITASEILRRVDGRHTTESPLLETPTLADAEAEHIARVLKDCDGNISEAARRLGIYRSSLQRKLRKLPPPPPRRS